MNTPEVHNYVLTNENRARVAELIQAIAGRLLCEGVHYDGYTTQRAQKALAPCVCGPMLQRIHLEYEHEVIGLLA